jgi:predicted transcriptional regulator
MDSKGAKLFGTDLRTRVLTAIAVLGDSYPRELARVVGASPYSVLRVVDSLDREGVIASRVVGKERRVSLDPRFLAASELRALLLRLGEVQPEYRRFRSAIRKRPVGLGSLA